MPNQTALPTFNPKKKKKKSLLLRKKGKKKKKKERKKNGNPHPLPPRVGPVEMRHCHSEESFSFPQMPKKNPSLPMPITYIPLCGSSNNVNVRERLQSYGHHLLTNYEPLQNFDAALSWAFHFFINWQYV